MDLLFVTSVTNGLDNVWQGITDLNETAKREGLIRVMEAYRDAGVKTAFYAIHTEEMYSTYLPFAKAADAVFVLEEDLVEPYKRDCKHERVQVLPLGVNPLVHNPIGMKKVRKNRDVLFTGSWGIYTRKIQSFLH